MPDKKVLSYRAAQCAKTVTLNAEFKIGGRPYLLEPLETPVCEECGQPMAFIAQIPLKAPLPMARRFHMAYVFMCARNKKDRSICHSYLPYSGANAVFLQRGSRGRYGCDANAQFPQYGFDLEPHWEPFVDHTTLAIDNPKGDEVSEATKIGGVPGWIQDSEVLQCRYCQGEMAFVGQISYEVTLRQGKGNPSTFEKAIEAMNSLEVAALARGSQRVHVYPMPDGPVCEAVGPSQHGPGGEVVLVMLPSERKEIIFSFGIAYVFLCCRECSPTSAAFFWQC